MKYPSFSSFRELLNDWDCYLAEENLKDKVSSLVNSPAFIFFFEKGGDIYGGPEESRITFARMKSKDQPKGWQKEATFMAVNLSSVARNEGAQQVVLGQKDVSKMKIVDKDKAEKILFGQAKKSGGALPGSPHADRIAMIIRKHRIL